MKLRAIRLHNVRRFADRGIAIEGIDDGVNVLAESNEFGKSTVFDAVHALFFQPHKGKPKPIQLLQPYSKGAVTVEAEIDTPEGVFRLRKRWYGSALSHVSDANGRIIAQADEADRWIDAKMRGGATGPAGLLWVQQGVVEMGQGTKTAADAEKAAREDVLSSVSGEIETLTGGRRTTQVLAKCTDELNAYVTATGKPKTGGAYVAALVEYETLTASAEEMTARVAGLRGDLDRRATARKRLTELRDTDMLARDTKALSDADAALKQAQDQAAQLEKATLTETLATQERDAAQEVLTRFDTAVEMVSNLTKRVATEQEQHAQASEARAKAEATLTEAVSAVTTQRDALQAVETLLYAARAATLAKAAAVRLTESRQTLTDADEAGRAAETERATAKVRALPEAHVKAVQKQEETIATLTAELRASSISVRVFYTDPASGAVRRDGAVLGDGETVSLDQTAQFDIDGVGTLTVAPGAGDRTTGLAEKLSAAVDTRAAQLAELGVASLNAAHQRQASVAEHVRAAERHETRRDTLAPKGLDVLRTEVARLESEVGDLPEPTESVEVLTTRRDATRESRNTAEAAQTAAQSALAETDRALVARETNLRRSREALERETAALGESSDPAEARRALSDALAVKKSAFDVAQEGATALRQSAPDLANLTAIQKRAASVLERTRDEADTLEKSISELNGSIGARAEEGIEEDLAATEGRRARAAERVAEIEIEIATLNRLRDVLRTAKADAKEHFFEPVVKELKPLLEIVFGDAKVIFDESTLLPVSLERAGEVESFDVLSGGMREQITILTRLAFARLLAQDGRTVPVILDDALIYSDDDRIERMFNALHRQAMDLQILVFTCRQRAFHQLGGRALVMQDWSPEI